jgi:hypothetical protein
MIKKSLIIIFLSILLGLFLYFRTSFDSQNNEARIIDRLPDAEYIGSSSLLDLAKETSPLLYFYKIKNRDLSSVEFLLAQAKNFGLNVQEKMYFFYDESGEGGLMFHVTDSTKVLLAIKNFNAKSPDENKSENKNTVYFSDQLKLNFHCGTDYLLLYSGKKFPEIVKRVSQAKFNQQSTLWKEYLSLKVYKNENTTVFATTKKIKELGFDYALFSHNSDSANVYINGCLHNYKGLNPSLLKSGKGFVNSLENNRSIELHIDSKDVNTGKDFPFKALLFEQGSKISFPTAAFINAWGGELSFSEGGKEIIKERVIVSEMDEDFNVFEVVKYNSVKVPKYSLMFNTNDNGASFIRLLLKKGILRPEGKYYRFLYSPLLKMEKNDNYYLFYSGEKAPKIVQCDENKLYWEFWKTNCLFKIESMSQNDLFISAKIPAIRAIEKLKKVMKS